MAAGTLLTVLANIPWGQVVDNAPKVADAASRLWNVVRRKKAGEDDDAAGPAGNASLPARIAALEERIAALDDQMRATSELIKALAEQNAQLVQAVERERQRHRRFAVAAGIVAVLLAMAAAAPWLR